ncbi:SAF domain-containing protein [Cellulomonas endophytica]|uniref:SAF domain-containing protein n=1 Tax=Cellulomonas endophytica TaxID=2494735 RepID=UPI0010106062|nr:SAF domain-containing protein [Cellulomonas endophytica]
MTATLTGPGAAVRPAGDPAGLPAPQALRLRRPGRRDPRLLVGLALVVVSVLLGSWAVRAAGGTVPVLVARTALVPGHVLADGDVTVAEVRLLDAARYLPGDRPLPEGATVVRTVGAGELVPVAALAAAADLGLRPVSVPLAATPPDDLVVGSLVDLWQVPEPPAGTGTGGTGALGGAAAPPTPRRLAEALTVAEVDRTTGALAAAGGTTVHVLVPTDLLPDVLAALAGGGTVDVVLVPGAAG